MTSDQQQTVLVVDDVPAFRALVRKWIEAAGYRVVELSSGIGVIEAIEAHQVELILLDIMMEERDGMETILEVRKQHRTLPVIAVSSDRFYLSLIEGFGVNDVLEKPVERNHLLQSIDRWIGKKGAS